MIIIDGSKFACYNCIRGHRSSTCKHRDRNLVQVRGRGRPALNAGHRVVVTEAVTVAPQLEHHQSQPIFDLPIQAPPSAARSSSDTSKSSSTASLVPTIHEHPNDTPSSSSSRESSKKSCCGGGVKKSTSSPTEPPKPMVCCSSKSQKLSCCGKTSDGCKCTPSTIILKAAKTEFADLSNGQMKFVGPASRQSQQSFPVNPPGGDMKRARHNPGPCCPRPSNPTPGNGLDLQHVSTFLVQEVHPCQAVPQQNEFMPIQPKMEHPTTLPQLSFGTSYHSADQQQYPHHDPQLQGEQFNMYLTQGCTTECECGPECSCVTCLVHRTAEQLQANGLLDTYTNTSNTPSDTTSSDRTNFNNFATAHDSTPDPTSNDLLRFTIAGVVDTFSGDDCMCPDDACNCHTCAKHGIFNGVKLAMLDGSSYREDNEFEGFTMPQFGDEHDCQCKPEECACYDCAKHGIANGVRVNGHLDQQR